MEAIIASDIESTLEGEHLLQFDLCKKTYDYLVDYINSSTDPDAYEKRYRIEHTLRVAAIGQEIAKAEGLDETALVLGCLLHDIGKYDSESNRDHGRASAVVARPFLQSLGLEHHVVEEICYGIAIHVDGKADFDHPFSILAESISDCDNIDRFDVYRVYDSLRYDKIEDMTSMEITQHLTPRIKRLQELQATHEMATPTATTMFRTNIKKQLAFYQALISQMESTSFLSLRKE